MIYKGEKQKEICFPLGGIGTGSIGLSGNGRLRDFEIFNRPAKGSENGYTAFVVKAVKNGKSYVKVLSGDYERSYMGDYAHKNFTGYGFGVPGCSMGGFPHFKNVTFKGEFPVAEVYFSDEDFPCEVKLTAFNPFIPLDSKNGSIPCAIFAIEAVNPCDKDIEFTVYFSVRNPFPSSENKEIKTEEFSGIHLVNAGVDKTDIAYGDLTVATRDKTVKLQRYWYRGSWQDGIVTFWNEVASGGFGERSYETSGRYDHCTVASSVLLKKGEKRSSEFVLTWNTPNNYNYWSPVKDDNGKDVTWKNYYATVFASSVESMRHVFQNFDYLKTKTFSFRDELFACTLDESVKDAVSSTLSVLKSPTVYRLENGEFYAFEGVHEQAGSCEGTCQHVWNYAYAMCFLFPDLERSIRDVEQKYTTDPDGRTHFRVALPLGRANDNFHPCVDGQMGSVLKIYREWKISGDRAWLVNKWDTVTRILEYAWSEKNPYCWDRDKDGVLEGRQHHTLDMELYGPSSWLEGFYLAALKAASEMAEYLGYTDKAAEYTGLFNKGKSWADENLFNGEYFIQKIDLGDKKILDRFNETDSAVLGCYWNAEREEIKYQIGEGCEIDQLCGQWHADILGLGDIFDKKKVTIALKNMYKNNYKPSLRNFCNPWRVFALNDESASIMCDYPSGKYKPYIPLPYCEESMTGFEYQFAGLLIGEGYIREGLDVVKAIRGRYSGDNRNPWNEIECGSNYARSMASFALIPIFSGFLFDMPHRRIGFNPIEKREYFRCIWSLDKAYGRIEIGKQGAKLKIFSGELPLKEFVLPMLLETPSKLLIDGEETAFNFENGTLHFVEQTVKESVQVII